MKAEDIIELSQAIGEFKPLVSKVVEDLKMFEDEWNQFTGFIVNEQVKARTKLFAGFVKEGFSREEAMTLTLASVKDMKETLSKLSKK